MNVAIAAATLLSITTASLGVVVAGEDQYIERPDGAVVGRLGGGSCVPIGAHFALTANHVFASRGKTILLNGMSYTIKNVYPHPDAPSVDLKVVEIYESKPFPEWVQIHPDPFSVQPGTPVYIGGWGKVASDVNGACVDWGNRLERWAMNEIEGHIAGTWSWYRFDIENPNEGIAAVYDSGSPMLVADPDECMMALVGVATSATSGAEGPSCDNHTAHYVNVDPVWLAPFSGAACPGDLDMDGDTDVQDFSILLANFGAVTTVDACPLPARGDLNFDGVLDVDDVAIFVTDFGCMP
jgi:hypothetical protein